MRKFHETAAGGCHFTNKNEYQPDSTNQLLNKFIHGVDVLQSGIATESPGILINGHAVLPLVRQQLACSQQNMSVTTLTVVCSQQNMSVATLTVVCSQQNMSVTTLTVVCSQQNMSMATLSRLQSAKHVNDNTHSRLQTGRLVNGNICMFEQAGEWKGNKGSVSDTGRSVEGKQRQCLTWAAQWKGNKGSVSDTGR